MKFLSPRRIAWIVLLLATAPLRAQQTLQSVPAELVAYPDLVLYNGKIATMNDSSLTNAQGRVVEAIAIRGDRIRFIGTNSEVLRFAGPQTRKLDLKGRTVLPGFMNTHTHIHDHALWLWSLKHPEESDRVMKKVAVSGKTFDELTRSIELVMKEHRSTFSPGQWAWIALPEGTPLKAGLGLQYLVQRGITRKQLDAIESQIPVFVHANPKWLLNTAARNMFLNMYDVPPSDDNEMGLDLNSTFRRSLMVDGYFRSHLDELARITEDAMKYQSALGFTTFSSHIEPLRIHDAYQMLVRGQRMPLRFAYADSNCEQVEPDKAGCLRHRSDIAGQGDKFFWNIGVTLRTIDAEPPEICSTMEMPREFKARERCILAPGSLMAKGARAALLSRLRFLPQHSAGDKGLDYFFDIVDDVMKEDPSLTMDYIRSLRISSDHCIFYPRKEQIPRMAKLGMIASCSPTYVTSSPPWLQIFGEQYADRVGPIKSMLAGGIMTVAEGEFDVETGEGPTVLAKYVPYITRTSVNRPDKPVAPQEAIDRVTLMKMMTVWPSYYVLKEKDLGTLEPGKFADLVILNKDYFTVPISELPTVYPVMTMVGGKVQVLRQEYSAEAGLPAAGPQLKLIFEETPIELGRPPRPVQQ